MVITYMFRSPVVYDDLQCLFIYVSYYRCIFVLHGTVVLHEVHITAIIIHLDDEYEWI